jgi:rubrerythrin
MMTKNEMTKHVILKMIEDDPTHEQIAKKVYDFINPRQKTNYEEVHKLIRIFVANAENLL